MGRVIKNRCLPSLFTEGSDLSHSGSWVCPSFVPSCSVSVCLFLRLITLPCHHVSRNYLPCSLFPSTSPFLPSNDSSSINKWAEKSFWTNNLGSDFSFSPSLSLFRAFGSIFPCLHSLCLQSELSLDTASIHYCHRLKRKTAVAEFVCLHAIYEMSHGIRFPVTLSDLCVCMFECE